MVVEDTGPVHLNVQRGFADDAQIQAGRTEKKRGVTVSDQTAV